LVNQSSHSFFIRGESLVAIFYYSSLSFLGSFRMFWTPVTCPIQKMCCFSHKIYKLQRKIPLRKYTTLSAGSRSRWDEYSPNLRDNSLFHVYISPLYTVRIFILLVCGSNSIVLPQLPPRSFALAGMRSSASFAWTASIFLDPILIKSELEEN